MRNDSRRHESIEKDLVESREHDHETRSLLAEAAGRLAEAEDVFRRLAEPDWSR